MNNDIEHFAGRFAGSFDLSPDEAQNIGHDSEVSLRVKGIVKKLTLEDTRSGELRLFFVIRPLDVQVDPDAKLRRSVELVAEAHAVLSDEPEAGRVLVTGDDPSGQLVEGDPAEEVWDDPDAFLESVSDDAERDAYAETIATAKRNHDDPEVMEALRQRIVELDTELREERQRSDQPPTGQRVSDVQERSNVAGSSQAERDKELHRFLYDTPNPGRP